VLQSLRKFARSLLANALLIGLATAWSLDEGLACGYEDPTSVSQGFLNWLYPDSLHVVGAISMAVAEKRLPPPNFNPAVQDLFGSRFRKTAKSLAQFGGALRGATPTPPSLSFSLVVVEAVLWTRFEADPDGLHTQIHVTGPTPGDVVLVSGESVIFEIVAGRLTIGEAYDRGYLRLYGTKERVDQFLGMYKNVGEAVIAAVDINASRWVVILPAPAPVLPAWALATPLLPAWAGILPPLALATPAQNQF
jgi:hypothetical protein